MPTIELGELGGEARTGASRPAPAATAPPRRHRTVRPVWLAAVLVGLLGPVAAGEPVPRPWPETTVPARLGSTVFAERDWMFVAAPAPTGGGGAELTAYRLPGGGPRWRATLPTSDLGSPWLLGDTLLLATYSERLGGAGRLTAVDVPAGTVSWSRPASLLVVADTGDAVLWVPSPDRPPEAETPESQPPEAETPENRPATLEVVDPASGAVRWSLPVPVGARPSFDTSAPEPAGPVRATMLVLPLPSGRVEVRDLGTGALLRAGLLAPPRSGGQLRWWGEVVGDQFLVHEERVVTAYGLPGLDRRWSVPDDQAAEQGPYACGTGYLCSLRHGGGARVWDAATGDTRWTDDRWAGLRPVGDVLIAARVGTGETEELAVVDPATGRVLAELGPWAVFTPHDGRLVGVRYGTDRRALVAEFDPATWRRHVLALLPEVSGDCGLTATVLHCRRLDASVGVWRLPR
ncbi:PQQ-binding-like beta-propeller repeat protein [Plantactinospora sp. WMMC1484]|uniref:outer membrane protein assembly factor BamB family protein n=1 Tax=Plantactinospora sp. WMMC1484 TaxID=3404122 RepID=UPI003BF538D0